MSNEHIETHESNDSMDAKKGAPLAWNAWSKQGDGVSDAPAHDAAAVSDGAVQDGDVPADAEADDAVEAVTGAEAAEAVADTEVAADAAADVDAEAVADTEVAAGAETATGTEAAVAVDVEAPVSKGTSEAAASNEAHQAPKFDNYDFNVNGTFSGNGGVVSRNAPRQLNPFGKVIACVLSVLVALTTWNSYSIEVAREMIIGDDATPMASTAGGDELLDDVDNGDTTQAANKDGDAGGDDSADGDGADTPDEGGEAGDDAKDADDSISEADMQAYLPKDLIDADQVIPALSDDIQDKASNGVANRASVKADNEKAEGDELEKLEKQVLGDALAARMDYSLNATGALQASDGSYHVDDAALSLAPSFGNLPVLLDGGHLGGAETGDVVALTFTAPYIYVKKAATAAGDDAKDAEVSYGTTLSEEEWKARDGESAGMRAVIFGTLPAGWTVYTEHMGRYLKHDEKDLKKGLSGTIVFRYEGVQDDNGITVRETRGQLDAATALPELSATIHGKVPATEPVEVTAGYIVNSFTAARDEEGEPLMAEDGKTRLAEDVLWPTTVSDAEKLTLVNAGAQIGLTASVEPFGKAVADADGGFAAFLVTLESAKGTVGDRGYTLHVADLPSNVDGLGALVADGIVAFDATDLTAQDLAAVDPADTSTITNREGLGRELASVKKVAEGAADITFATKKGDALTRDAVSGKADNKRVLYVAVPYATAALTANEQAGGFAPEAIDLTLTAQVDGKLVQEEKTADAKTVNDSLADEDATYTVALPSQEVAFEAAPEPEPEPEPADTPADEPEPADTPAGDDEPTDEPAAEEQPADEPQADEGEQAEGPAYNEDGTIEPAIQPDPLMEQSVNELLAPLADFGIDLFAIAPNTGGNSTAMTENYFNPALYASNAGNFLGDDTYLVNSQQNPTISLQVEGTGNGYWGGWSLYGSDWYGSAEADETYTQFTYKPTTCNGVVATDLKDAVARAEADGFTPIYYQDTIAEHDVNNSALKAEDKIEGWAEFWKLKDYNQQKEAEGYEKMGTKLYLDVPYLYQNSEGGTASTYSYSDWVERGGGYAEDGNPANPGKGQMIALNFGTEIDNVLDFWNVYLLINDNNDNGNQKEVLLNTYLRNGANDSGTSAGDSGTTANDAMAAIVRDYPQLAGLNFKRGLTGRLMFE